MLPTLGLVAALTAGGAASTAAVVDVAIRSISGVGPGQRNYSLSDVGPAGTPDPRHGPGAVPLIWSEGELFERQ